MLGLDANHDHQANQLELEDFQLEIPQNKATHTSRIQGKNLNAGYRPRLNSTWFVVEN